MLKFSLVTVKHAGEPDLLQRAIEPVGFVGMDLPVPFPPPES